MAEPKKITEMWAWVVTEPDGGEGIPAFNSRFGWMPMVGADEQRIRSLSDMASLIAGAHEPPLPLKLVRFTTMEVIEHG